jgi:long-chain fatty acid transport protein
MVLLSSLLCAQSFAAGSGAFRLEVPDAGAVGKGSAFVGEANTPVAVYYNPAGMTLMKKAAISVGASLIQPKVDYKSNSGDESQMRRGSYVIPNMFFVQPVGEKFAVGFGAMSSWGLTTSWNPDSFARYNATKSVMENKDFLISAAYQLNDQFSFALSLDIDDSHVDKQKKLAQGVGADGNFQLKGDSTGYGYRIAGLYKLNERHQFGFMYRSTIQHKYKGKITLKDLNNAAGSNMYQAVFGATDYETDVISKMVLPDSIVLGYSFKPTSKWTFNADVEWMNWSVVNEEELACPSESDPTRNFILAGTPGSNDWQSAISAAVGLQYDITERFRVRTGYYHHQAPVPTNNWQANMSDAVSHGVTLGLGYDFTESLTLDLAWSGIYYMKREIDNTVAGGTINGTYRQTCNLLYLTATYKF